jgi:flagellar protein FliL
MTQTEANSPKPKSAPWTMFLMCLIVAGVAIFFWERHVSMQAQAGHPSTKTTLAAVLHLETFTLNIDDPDQRAYLRVGIDLGLDRDPKESGGTTPPTAVVRDTILNVLMATKLQDVTTVEGKRKLKDQILVALQQRVPDMAVREVYFTDFLVQR